MKLKFFLRAKNVKYERVSTDQDSDFIEILADDLDYHPIELINSYRSRCFFSYKFLFFILTIVLLVLSIVLFQFLIKRPDINKVDKVESSLYNEWSFNLNSSEFHSCIKLIDIDEDGLDDILFGVLVGISFKIIPNKFFLSYLRFLIKNRI